MAILTQFLLRLSFGLAAAMGITSSEKVSSGYFRNHLYVTLGLCTFAALVASRSSTIVASLAVVAAVLSYVGSVCWGYESARAGKLILWLVAACALASAWAATPHDTMRYISVVTSGLVLGTTIAAMLLGHWYLNSPGMELGPLRRLLVLMAIAVGIQAMQSALGVADELRTAENLSRTWWLFIALRWSFGLLGVLATLWMAWQTLNIPNTQSATGILYVAVIGVFVGELTALLLSAESAFPV